MAAKFEIKISANTQFFFNLKAANGQVILSSEMYEAKSGALSGIDSVKTNALSDDRYERKTSVNSQPYFVLKARNGEIIGKSEIYASDAAMENGIASVKTNAAVAEIADLSA
jgi:uncharacterized protein